MSKQGGQFTIRRGQHVRIGESWYRVLYLLPRPLVDENGRRVNLLLDRFGSVEYGNSSDVSEFASDLAQAEMGDWG